MYCQKCRKPLKLDSSLDDLNPAAYDLLVATHSQQTPKKPTSRTLHSQDRARKPLYDQVSRNAGQATFKRQSGLGLGLGLGSGPGSGRGDGQLRDNPAMSFIYLTESQVASPAHDPSSPSPPRQKNARGVQQQVGMGGGTAIATGSAHSANDDADDSNSNNNNNNKSNALLGLGRPASFSASASASGGDDDDDAMQSPEMERITKLFEILSARSDLDHPVCVECTEILVEEMQKKLEAAARERDTYVGFLREMEAAAPTEEESRAQEERLREARRAEAAAREELRALEREKAALDEELLGLEEEARRLDLEEDAFWRERNTFAARLAEFQNERDSVNSRFDHDSRLLEKLQRSNVYNDTFTISHDGTFATINGLRLGRAPNKLVEWPEINAAWGHALLLLVTVADKLAYRFEGYDPQPLGSTSRIFRLEQQQQQHQHQHYPSSMSSSRTTIHHGDNNNTNNNNNNNNNNGITNIPGPPPPPIKRHALDLFSSGDMLLGLAFMHRKFDQAMVAFLELVRQLGVHVQRQTTAEGTPLSLPYRIEGDRIGEFSIKLGIAQESEQWSKACKLTLTCCKFLLAHASNVSSVANGRVGG